MPFLAGLKSPLGPGIFSLWRYLYIVIKPSLDLFNKLNRSSSLSVSFSGSYSSSQIIFMTLHCLQFSCVLLKTQPPETKALRVFIVNCLSFPQNPLDSLISMLWVPQSVEDSLAPRNYDCWCHLLQVSQKCSQTGNLGPKKCVDLCSDWCNCSYAFFVPIFPIIAAWELGPLCILHSKRRRTWAVWGCPKSLSIVTEPVCSCRGNRGFYCPPKVISVTKMVFQFRQWS